MATSAVVRLYTTVKDIAGRYGKTVILIALSQYNPTTGTGAAWKALVVALLNPDSSVEKQSTSSDHVIGGTSSGGARGNREDKATLELMDANGQTHTFRIPTPSTAIALGASSDKVDITNTNVRAWGSAMVSHALTSDGVAYTGNVTGGKFIRHKYEKKGGF